MMQDRDFSRVPLNASLGPSGSGNIPGGRVSLSARATGDAEPRARARA